MRAAARGHADVARALLDAGADVSAQRGDGFTPLILAVFFGHEPVVRLLVERGANAHARTSLGTTASRWAASRGFEEMADLLRDAEAARPPAVAPAAVTTAASVTTAAAPVAAPSPAATPPPDEVSIFARKVERRDARGAVSRALALTGGGASVLSEESARNAPESKGPPPDVSRADASRPDDASRELSPSSPAGVSVRSSGQVPSHPSASTFRLGHFLRSWQGSVGTAMLLLALGVAVFALMRGGAAPRDAAPTQATPTPVAPQAASQVQPTPLAQPTPAFPTPDPLAVVPVTDPAYAVPGAAGQPFYVPQPAPGPVPANVPRELTVVSENGAPANENSARAPRRPEPGANDAPSARPDTRTDAGTDADARAARTPEP